MEVDEHSDSEEEILVYAEFSEGVDVGQYRSIHVLGVDGTNPIIQADDSFFIGKFVNALGTYMFFEEDLEPQTADPLFDKLPEKSLKYLCKTSKLLDMDHAYVMPKASGEEQIVKNETEDSDVISPVRFTSLNEALQNFKTALAPLIVNPDESHKAKETEATKEIVISDSVVSDEAMNT